MRLIPQRILLVSAPIAFVLASACLQARAQQPPQSLRIGVLAKRGADRCLEKWGPTAEYLTKEIPGYSFSIVPLPYNEVYPALEGDAVHFVLVNSSFYVALEQLYGASRIATLKNMHAGKSSTTFGGVIFCRADRTDMQNIDDLKGKTFMAVEETSFGGWQMAWRELREQGIDPHQDFTALSFGGTHDAVVHAVRDGEVDAGTVRTDALERMEHEGKIVLADFHVFHEHGGDDEHLQFLHSTRAYPEWPFAKTKHTSEEHAEKVTAALLGMSSVSPAAKAARCAGWTIPNHYQAVRECLKYLRVTPYEDYGKVTLTDVIRQHGTWLLSVFVALVLIVLSALRVARLNAELRQTDKKLRESERFHKGLLDDLLTFVGVLNPNGDIVFINNTPLELAEIALDDLVGKKFYDAYWWEYSENAKRTIERDVKSCASGQNLVRDIQVKTADGSLIWIEFSMHPIMTEDGTVKYLVPEGRDVTERKRARDEIGKFKTIAENAKYGVAITDTDGDITYINECFAWMHGYTIEELIGQNLSVFHTEEQFESVSKMIEDLIKNGSFSPTEVWHKRRDGSVFPTLMNGVAIKDENGEAQFIAGMASDISEFKRLQDFEERAKRLETAGRIAGQVAHDLNNLLGPLVAYPELIKSVLPAGHPVAEYVNRMEMAAGQIAEINQQLLTLGRRGHYNTKPLNVNSVIARVLDQALPLPGTLIIDDQLSPDLMPIMGGEAQILRAISNLVGNSFDAMQGIGTLTIKTQNWYVRSVTGKYVQIPMGEYAKIILSDTGCGIKENVQKRIFEPFFTTKVTEKRRGSGLGLSVVHAVVEDHGGFIDMESQVDQGTTFYLYFPITRVDTTTAQSETFEGGDETILVVDDDELQRGVTLKLLNKLGYKAQAVGSGEEALKRVAEDPPQLLMLDMVMEGGMDGTETYQRALQLNPSQKAIIVSGFSESERIEEAYHLGAVTFVRKPLTLKSLAHAVRKELDKEQPVPAC